MAGSGERKRGREEKPIRHVLIRGLLLWQLNLIGTLWKVTRQYASEVIHQGTRNLRFFFFPKSHLSLEGWPPGHSGLGPFGLPGGQRASSLAVGGNPPPEKLRDAGIWGSCQQDARKLSTVAARGLRLAADVAESIHPIHYRGVTSSAM